MLTVLDKNPTCIDVLFQLAESHNVTLRVDGGNLRLTGRKEDIAQLTLSLQTAYSAAVEA